MDEKDWIFGKWPKWLRWICALPFAIIASFVLPLIAGFANGYMGFNMNSGYGKTIIQLASIAGFLGILYTCVPKFKEIITGIFSLLLSMLALLELYFNYLQGNLMNWDSFVILLVFIGCIIFSVCIFIEYGKQKSNNESDFING